MEEVRQSKDSNNSGKGAVVKKQGGSSNDEDYNVVKWLDGTDSVLKMMQQVMSRYVCVHIYICVCVCMYILEIQCLEVDAAGD